MNCMHKLYVLLAGVCMATGSMAQTDTTKKPTADTIHVGGITIIKTPSSGSTALIRRTNIIMTLRRAAISGFTRT